MLIGTLTIKSLFSVHIFSIATIKQPLTPVVLLSLQCVTVLSLNPLYSLYYFMTRNEGERQSVVQQTTVGICHGRNLQSEIHSFLSTINTLKSHSYSLRSDYICRFSQSEGQALLWELHNHAAAILDRPPFRSGITKNVFTAAREEQGGHTWLSLGKLSTEKMSNSTTCVKGWGGSYPLEPAQRHHCFCFQGSSFRYHGTSRVVEPSFSAIIFRTITQAQLTANLLHSLV